MQEEFAARKKRYFEKCLKLLARRQEEGNWEAVRAIEQRLGLETE